MAGTGFEPTPEFSTKERVSVDVDAKSYSLSADSPVLIDPDICRLVAAWPRLPDDLKAQILKLTDPLFWVGDGPPTARMSTPPDPRTRKPTIVCPGPNGVAGTHASPASRHPRSSESGPRHPIHPPRVRNLFGPLPTVRPQPIGVTDECAMTWVAARFRCPREGANGVSAPHN
jgi:hypothetical protein